MLLLPALLIPDPCPGLCSFPGCLSSAGSAGAPAPGLCCSWRVTEPHLGGWEVPHSPGNPFCTTAKWDSQLKQPPGKAQAPSALLPWHSPCQPCCALHKEGEAVPAPLIPTQGCDPEPPMGHRHTWLILPAQEH